ncbi:tetratricopeptide repeat-containing sensor histidine kinase [bacterium]|nr:tetratricopeptide repeat-containing sensor histidine kinase [bacterium]
MKQVYRQSKKDTVRVNVLCQLAWELKDHNLQLAEVYLSEALSLSEGLSFEKGLAEANKISGVVEWYKGNYAQAKVFLMEALVYYERLGYSSGIANTYNNLGLLYRVTGDYAKAGDWLKQSLDLRESIGDSTGIATSCNNLGVIYELTGDYNQALLHYIRALTIFENLQDIEKVPSSYINIGNIYHVTGDLKMALESFHTALEIHKNTSNLRGMGDAYINIGEAYSEMDAFDKALSNYEKALDISLKLDDKFSQTEILTSIGKMYQQKGDLNGAEVTYFEALEICRQINEKVVAVELYNLLGGIYNDREKPEIAITYLEKSADMAMEIHALPELRNSYQSLTRSYQLMGEYKKAFSYQSELLKVKDSLFDEVKTHEMADMRAKHKLDEREKNISYLNELQVMSQAKYNAERSKNLLLLLGLSLLATLAAVLYAGYLRKNKDNLLIEAKNEELADKNKELKDLNEAKNTLMGIVAHDLKNPLSQIRGLVNIVLTEPDNLSPRQKMLTEKIGESSDRLTHMIRKILDVEIIEASKLSLEMSKSDLCAMIRQTLEEYQLDAKRKNIQLDFDTDKGQQFAVVDPEFTHQIMGNLVSNAVKYTPQHKKIHVQLSTHKDQVQLRIRDEGPGITEADQKKLFGRFQKLTARPTGGEDSNGLGLSIVKKYVDAMNGKVWCESIPGSGATFVVAFNKEQVESAPE